MVFFPSYEYEKVVYQHWDKHGFLEKITAKKKVRSSLEKNVMSDIEIIG